MADKRRALLTGTEREILSGVKEVKDNYRYSVESRVRTRIKAEFVEDLELLKEHQPKMFELLVDAVGDVQQNNEASNGENGRYE